MDRACFTKSVPVAGGMAGLQQFRGVPDRYAARDAGRDAWAAAMLSKMDRPSSQPRMASLARSGCGISPATLNRSLAMPAMLSSDPLGFAPPSTPPRHRSTARESDVPPEAATGWPRRRSSIPRRGRSADGSVVPWHGRREWRLAVGGAQEDRLAVELQVAIADERSGKKPRLAQDLKRCRCRGPVRPGRQMPGPPA